MKPDPLTEKDFEWLRWSLDTSINDTRTTDGFRRALVGLRAKLAQLHADLPKPAKVWSCKIGFVPDGELPFGADSPMRRAVEMAFIELTGHSPRFIFSGWGAELDEAEREAIAEPASLVSKSIPVSEQIAQRAPTRA